MRWLATLFAANLLVTGLAAYAHLALSPHRYCILHGQFEGTGHEEGAALPPPSGERVPHPGERPLPQSGDDHHGCPVMAFAQGPVEATPGPGAPPTAIVEQPLPAGFPPPTAPFPGIPGLHLAPKSSPPPFLPG